MAPLHKLSLSQVLRTNLNMFYVLASPLVTEAFHGNNEVFNWECSRKNDPREWSIFVFTEDCCLNSEFHRSQFIIDNTQNVSAWVILAAPADVGALWVSQRTLECCWRVCFDWDLQPEPKQQLHDHLCSVPLEADIVRLPNISWSHQDTHPILSHRHNPWMRGPDPESYPEPFEV